MTVVSVCVPSLKNNVSESDFTFYCPCPTEFLTSNLGGVGAARKHLASHCRGDLIVMFDDDVTVSPDLWSFILALPRGVFCMAIVDGHVSTRVFAIHREDYLHTKGFDAEIKFTFEDGSFFVEALKDGLHFKVVPKNLFKHKDHVNRTGDNRRFACWFEHTKMLVKYKHFVYPGIVGFFGFRSLIREPHVFFIKIVGTLYWLIRGVGK